MKSNSQLVIVTSGTVRDGTLQQSVKEAAMAKRIRLFFISADGTCRCNCASSTTDAAIATKAVSILEDEQNYLNPVRFSPLWHRQRTAGWWTSTSSAKLLSTTHRVWRSSPPTPSWAHLFVNTTQHLKALCTLVLTLGVFYIAEKVSHILRDLPQTQNYWNNDPNQILRICHHIVCACVPYIGQLVTGNTTEKHARVQQYSQKVPKITTVASVSASVHPDIHKHNGAINYFFNSAVVRVGGNLKWKTKK